MSTHPDPGTEAAREVARIADRRLGYVEMLLLGGAVVLATIAGALTAWLANDAWGWPFRRMWVIASTTFVVVPLVVVWMRDLRTGPAHRAPSDADGH